MSADLMQDINGLIGVWQPRKTYHIGPNYLDDLKRFLQEKLTTPQSFFSGKKTTIEFVDGKGMDIGVKRKVGPSVEAVGIVMKRDLATLEDLKLLMEQVNSSREGLPGDVPRPHGNPDRRHGGQARGISCKQRLKDEDHDPKEINPLSFRVHRSPILLKGHGARRTVLVTGARKPWSLPYSPVPVHACVEDLLHEGQRPLDASEATGTEEDPPPEGRCEADEGCVGPCGPLKGGGEDEVRLLT